MKKLIRWIIFEYAIITGHDEYCCAYGSLKSKFFLWLYDGDAEESYGE